MAIFVNTNVTSLHGQRYLNNVNNQLNTTYQRLSSGLRINSAKDDAAGLLIADRLTTQINGLNQGNRNASDGIALMQTMEGGMDEISNMLQRVRTLAVQAANGTMTSDDRAAIQKETEALSSEISRIAEQTTYGGKQILMGADIGLGNAGTKTIFSNDQDSANGTAANREFGVAGKFSLQVGANQGNSIEFTVQSFELVSMVQKLDIKAARDGTQEDAGNDGIASGTGLGTLILNHRKNGTIDGTETTASTHNQDLAELFGIKIANVNVSGNSVAIAFALSTQASAESAITTIDALIQQVDSQRADLGAAQNRLESSIRNQSNVATNSSDARSRIRDTDFATESAALSQQNIIQQAATSMLMQANMRPQLGLSLLG